MQLDLINRKKYVVLQIFLVDLIVVYLNWCETCETHSSIDCLQDSRHVGVSVMTFIQLTTEH